VQSFQYLELFKLYYKILQAPLDGSAYGSYFNLIILVFLIINLSEESKAPEPDAVPQTLWSRALFEKMTAVQLLKKFLAFYCI
jgi:hypothetical protein